MQIFLSYHSPDRARARALKQAIEQAAPHVKIFFDESNLRFGHLWQPALSKHIQEAEAFIILVSSIAGDWQKFEYYEARDRKAKDANFILLPIVTVDPKKETVANLPGLTQLHWIISREPTSPEPLAKIVAALNRSAEPPRIEPWRLVDPYRGLQALEEQDQDFFFGREAETGQVLACISKSPGKLITLIGNSGVGKSSLAKAGIIGALKLQRPPGGGVWPGALEGSRTWAYLTMTPGVDPFAALVNQFLKLWQLDVTDTDYKAKEKDWASRLRSNDPAQAFTIKDLIDVTEARLKSEALLQTPPPRYFIYIDQGEELYTRTADGDRHKFSALISAGIKSLGDRLIVLTSLRADYYGVFQANTSLFPLAEKIDVAPLQEAQLARVLGEPARALAVSFENPMVVDHIVKTTGNQVDVLPLLADLFSDLWKRMRVRGDGVLRISDHPEIIQIGAALKHRADKFLSDHPGKVEAVKKLFALKLTEVPRVGEPVRAELERDDATPQGRAEWQLAEELAGPDLRLLVTGVKDGKSKAWVAHEVLLRTWPALSKWLDEQRDFLVWRSEVRARAQIHADAATGEKQKTLLMGHDLDLGRKWLSARRGDLDTGLVAFVDASQAAATKVQRFRQMLQSSVGLLLLAVIGGLLAYIYEQPLYRLWFEWRYVHARSAEEVLALPKGKSFLDCGDITGEPGTSRAGYSAQCPEMVVIPAGRFDMGSKISKDGDEGPVRRIRIPKPFAVSKFEITAEQWQYCVWLGGCPIGSGYGNELEAVSSINWRDAQEYLEWLGRLTGQSNRLLTEVEWEYSARAGTRSRYYWGNKNICDHANGADIAGKRETPKLEATNCDDRVARVAHVGSYQPNAYHLFDMSGNVWEWVQDCYSKYDPANLSSDAIDGDNNCERGLRGGSWHAPSDELRSSYRDRYDPALRRGTFGFRVARTIN